MKPTIAFGAGMFAGLFGTSIVFASVIYPLLTKDKFELGRKNGYITGAIDVIRFIDKHTQMDRSITHKTGEYFDIKDARLEVVKTDNLQFVRVYQEHD